MKVEELENLLKKAMWKGQKVKLLKIVRASKLIKEVK